jgi:hypothetical protein
VADWFNPPSAQEALVRVTRLAEQGQVRKAIESGESFLAKASDPAGDLHRKMADLYLAQGDAVSAVRHLQQSQSGARGMTPKPTPSSAGAAAPAAPTATAPAEPRERPGVGASVEGASARVRSDGSLEVRAGSAAATTGK